MTGLAGTRAYAQPASALGVNRRPTTPTDHAPTRLVRGLRRSARALGLLGLIERRIDRPHFLWMRSLFSIQDAEDLARLDVAWWPLRVLEEVAAFLATRPAARVFEYGPGASTVWLARRAAEVHYVEHHAGWKARLDDMLAEYPNVRGSLAEPRHTHDPAPYGSGARAWRHAAFDAYVHQIDRVGGPFDLIVIDGRCRSMCLAAARRHLAPGGLILFDNSARPRYQDAIRSCDLPARRLRGLTIGLPYPDQTTLFGPAPHN